MAWQDKGRRRSRLLTNPQIVDESTIHNPQSTIYRNTRKHTQTRQPEMYQARPPPLSPSYLHKYQPIPLPSSPTLWCVPTTVAYKPGATETSSHLAALPNYPSFLFPLMPFRSLQCSHLCTLCITQIFKRHIGVSFTMSFYCLRRVEL